MAVPFDQMNIDDQIKTITYVYGPAAAQQYLPTLIKVWSAAHFGALAAYLDVPEVGSLITQAATGGWTAEKLQVELANTNWWKTTNASQRQWDALSAEDPASAKEQVDQMAGSIKTLLGTEGVQGQYTDDQITALATTALRNGTPQADIPKMALAQAAYNPTQPVGKLGAQVTNVKQTAFQYGLPVSDQEAFSLAKNIEDGTQTAEAVTSLFQTNAKAAYGADPNLASQLDNGFTLRQILTPQISTISSLLGVDPNSLDISDPKWGSVIQGPDGKVANTNQTAQIVRSTTDWKSSQNGQQAAASFNEQLGKAFGAVG